MTENLNELWSNYSIPDIAEKDCLIELLTQGFISSQMKQGLTDYIQPYVERRFNYNKNSWAIVIKTIKNNYKHFRYYNWTEVDYIKVLSLAIILDKNLKRETLNDLYNGLKMGLYDEYFEEEEDSFW